MTDAMRLPPPRKGVVTREDKEACLERLKLFFAPYEEVYDGHVLDAPFDDEEYVSVLYMLDVHEGIVEPLPDEASEEKHEKHREEYESEVQEELTWLVRNGFLAPFESESGVYCLTTDGRGYVRPN